MSTVHTAKEVRWRWALGLAVAVVAVNWIVGHPDRLEMLGLFGASSGNPLAAEIAFLLSFILLGVIPALMA